MKKIIFLCLIALIQCSNSDKGVDLAFIKSEFLLPAGNPTIVNLDSDGVCPTIEFNSNNSTSFKVLLGPNDPDDTQSTFNYADDEYREEEGIKILTGVNESGSTFELTFDTDVTYTLNVDYNCENSADTDCVNTTYNCSGDLIE